MALPIPKFSTLGKRQQLAIAIGIPAAVAVVLGVVIYQKLGQLGPDPDLPAVIQRTSDPDSLWTRINALSEDIAKQVAIIDRGPLSQRKLDQLTKQIGDAEALLPRKDEIEDIIFNLNDLARKIPADIGRVTVISFKRVKDGSTSGGRPGANELPQISYDIEIDGTTNGIIKYIDSIERFEGRYIAVTNISIKPGKPIADKDSLHRAKLTFVTYIYQPKQKGGK